jgi:hypothetical protein
MPEGVHGLRLTILANVDPAVTAQLESLSDEEVADLSLGELSRELATPTLSKFVRECSSLR